MQLSVGVFQVVSSNRQPTTNVAKWDEDPELGMSIVELKTMEEALRAFNLTICRASVQRCKLKFTCRYRDAR